MAKLDLSAAHRHSSRHRLELESSEICGCFYCRTMFSPTDITDWLDEGDGTALCPRCGIDAVIGSASGYPITSAFLNEMSACWFGAG